MKKILSYLTLSVCLGLGLGLASFTGCDSNDGPAERAGEKLDEAGEEVKDEVDDATDD